MSQYGGVPYLLNNWLKKTHTMSTIYRLYDLKNEFTLLRILTTSTVEVL